LRQFGLLAAAENDKTKPESLTSLFMRSSFQFHDLQPPALAVTG